MKRWDGRKLLLNEQTEQRNDSDWHYWNVDGFFIFSDKTQPPKNVPHARKKKKETLFGLAHFITAPGFKYLKQKMFPSYKIIISWVKNKHVICWHTGGTPWDIFSLSKTRSEIQSKSRAQPIGSRCPWQQQHQLEEPLVPSFTHGWPWLADGVLRLHCLHGNIASSLLGEGEKEGKEERRHPPRRYLSIIHPLSLSACRMCVVGVWSTCMCARFSTLVTIGWYRRGEGVQTGAIITLGGAMHPATPCL